MKYKNYTYTEFIDRDEDSKWFVHEITYQSGSKTVPVPVDYSKRCQMTYTAFKLLVDLDFPERPKGDITFPWSERSLIDYKEELDYTRDFTIENDTLSKL